MEAFVKQSVTANSFYARIWIGGDRAEARRICRDFCDREGECVSVTDTDFLYTGGETGGIVVGFINYPRFPRSDAAIRERAEILAEILREELGQDSYTIEMPVVSTWVSYRSPE